jgi:PIN domain nuclease of toxin-antitoxin system
MQRQYESELIETSRRARQRPEDSTLSLGDGLCIAVAERLKLVITGGG